MRMPVWLVNRFVMMERGTGLMNSTVAVLALPPPPLGACARATGQAARQVKRKMSR